MRSRAKANKRRVFSTGAVIRRLLLAWLLVGTVQYTVLPQPQQLLGGTDGLAALSFPLTVGLTAAVFAGLCVLGRFFDSGVWERWAMPLCFGWYAAVALSVSFSVPFLLACLAVLAILGIYAVRGWNASSETPELPSGEKTLPGKLLVVLLAAGFVAFAGSWLLCRVRSYSAPTYDFGIFTQMFHNMRTSGVPNTTLERDGLLSHFKVHVSPIYYLLLPFYMIRPKAETLELLQVLVLASAVIPLWRIARRNGLPQIAAALLCGLLLVYPAYSGGTSYDLHENVFLTPLLLWLFDALDRRKTVSVALFALLTLLVKEDAAVYVAVTALWALVRGLLHRDRRGILSGALLLTGALAYFVGVTTYLSVYGDGVMSYRYDNFIYDGSGSLLTVVKAVLMLPMKAVYECMDAEKTEFILLTMGPLLFLPLFTRHYERFLLLIPYVLVNLMSDYQYQHSIFFQYTYGATACLFYLTAVNLADLWLAVRLKPIVRLALPSLSGAALILSTVMLVNSVVPSASYFWERYRSGRQTYAQLAEHLERIPEDASVTATTFFTVPLSGRETLYDLEYASREHLLSSEYVVLDDSKTYRMYTEKPWRDASRSEICMLLEENGYTVCDELPGYLTVYKKA